MLANCSILKHNTGMGMMFFVAVVVILASLGSGVITRHIVDCLRDISELPKKKRPVTKILGAVETSFFAGLFIFLSIHSDEPSEIADRLFLVVTAWLGIKTLGYKPDDRSEEDQKNKDILEQDQTATKYVYLLGTFISIGMGLLIGWVITRVLS